MTIYFRSRKLQKVCSARSETEGRLGATRARKLHQRLMELQAAQTLSDISRVPPARCHELTDNRKGQLSVDLDHPYRLLFVPANTPVPYGVDGGLDWTKVTEIEIIGIDDIH